jgi:hypothetical protein
MASAPSFRPTFRFHFDQSNPGAVDLKLRTAEAAAMTVIKFFGVFSSR